MLFVWAAGEFAGEEDEELPEWDPSGSYDDEGEEPWEGDGEEEPDLPPSEEELAEGEISRQGEGPDVAYLHTVLVRSHRCPHASTSAFLPGRMRGNPGRPAHAQAAARHDRMAY